VNFLGPGEIGGHALLNLNLDYKLDRGLRYSRSSPTSSTGVTPPPARCSRTSSPAATWRAPGAQVNETFYAPGAPRALWVGIQFVPDAARSGRRGEPRLTLRQSPAYRCRQR